MGKYKIISLSLLRLLAFNCDLIRRLRVDLPDVHAPHLLYAVAVKMASRCIRIHNRTTVGSNHQHGGRVSFEHETEARFALLQSLLGIL